jgi:hypothetical protein
MKPRYIFWEYLDPSGEDVVALFDHLVGAGDQQAEMKLGDTMLLDRTSGVGMTVRYLLPRVH